MKVQVQHGVVSYGQMVKGKLVIHEAGPGDVLDVPEDDAAQLLRTGNVVAFIDEDAATGKTVAPTADKPAA